MNSYCANSGAGRPTFQPNFLPLIARHRKLTKKQTREADRLRKAKDRMPPADAESPDSDKWRIFILQLLNHVADCMDRPDVANFGYTEIEAFVDSFLKKYELNFDEFAKWCGGPTSLLLGVGASRFAAQATGSEKSHAMFGSFMEAFTEPERMCVALEQGNIPNTAIVKTFLYRLPEGTSLQRWAQLSNSFDAERMGRMAALTGLTWQLALLAASLFQSRTEVPTPNLAPLPTEKGGQRWSSGPAWILCLAEFENKYHGTQRTGKRGPESVARKIHSLIAKSREGANGSEYKIRKLNRILSGQEPLTFKVVEDICRAVEGAMVSEPDGSLRSALAENRETSWEDQLMRLRIQGHIAGFLRYIERVWEYASGELDQPLLLQDLHDIWQDWPLIFNSALDDHRNRLAELGQ